MARGRRGGWGWRLALIAAMAVAALVLYLAVTVAQVLLASRPSSGSPASADALVVLGAAQYDGEPSGALAGRLDRANELFAAGRGRVIVVTGGNQPGDRFTEGLTGFAYLRAQGVAEEVILIEVDSANTFEAVSAAALIVHERGMRSAILISDPYHNLRLRAIADEVGLEATVAATDSGLSRRAVVRESIAVAAGRLVGFRRLARWA